MKTTFIYLLMPSRSILRRRSSYLKCEMLFPPVGGGAAVVGPAVGRGRRPTAVSAGLHTGHSDFSSRYTRAFCAENFHFRFFEQGETYKDKTYVYQGSKHPEKNSTWLTKSVK